ncbi:hypothetical protein GIB67_040376, partial [Kingdonia uniflora]
MPKLSTITTSTDSRITQGGSIITGNHDIISLEESSVLNIIARCMAHYNLFDNLQLSGDESNIVDTGNNSSSNTSSKKKRGLARDSKSLPNGKKKKIGVEERGVTDEEIDRVEMYIPAHTKKDKTIQCPDVIVSRTPKNTMRNDPKSIRRGPNDANAQKFGKGRKGGTRGMGAGMSISLVEKVGHIVNENEELRSNNNELKFATEKLRKDLDVLTNYDENIPLMLTAILHTNLRIVYVSNILVLRETLKLNEVSVHHNSDLRGNHLSGQIPDEIGDCSSLKSLDLSFNEIYGDITISVSKLKQLESLDLSCNLLSGPIPAILGNLTYTEKLYLHSNKLSGTIPPELGNMTNLYYLELNNNQLSGPIPSELGKLTDIFDMNVASNKLEGSIPDNLSSCTNLNSLNVYSNKLNGTIPPAFEKLESMTY